MNGRATKTLYSLTALLSLSLAFLYGCGKANPTAPGASVTLSANPPVITSTTGSSTITAVVYAPSGIPAAGVDVRFTTTLGTIDVLRQTNGNGIATATLKGDGRGGVASVSASVDGGAASGGGGTSTGTTTGTTTSGLSVPIGGTAIGGSGATITLQAVPASISSLAPVPVKLVALVRDSAGNPVSGAEVNFSTNLGRLASGGGLKPTDVNGQAVDTLTVQASDIGNQTSITVGADTAASDGSLKTATFTIAILTNAAASITAQANPTVLPLTGGTVTLSALVRSSTGAPVAHAGVNFTTTLGTLASGGGLISTDNNGQATDTLTITQQPGPGPITVTVTAVTAGAGSTLITSNSVTITLQAGG
jgi:hypothetical protein